MRIVVGVHKKNNNYNRNIMLLHSCPNFFIHNHMTSEFFKPFKVEYTYRGERVLDDAYLTVTVAGKAPSRQVIVLPTCKRIIARWESDDPVDLEALRARAVANVPMLNNLTDDDVCIP